jgi:hypothetical protein
MNQLPQIPEIKMPEQFKNVGESLGNTIGDLKENVNSSVTAFSEKTEAGIGASTEFLQSNTIFAKFAFLLLAIILFVFLSSLGILLITYFLSSPANPYIIKGMIDGNDSKIITQDPKNTNSIEIIRSNNRTTGLEFTWSFWIYLSDINSSSTTYQHVFNKGDTNFSSISGIAKVNNSPGVYISPGNNGLRIIMDSVVSNDSAIVDISNIPIRKWFHTAVRVQNTIMDLYINGIIANRYVMNNVPKQNYSDINYAQNGGFIGKLSNLRYYSYAMNVFEINGIVTYGPNTNTYSLTTASAAKGGDYSYISNSWYNN